MNPPAVSVATTTWDEVQPLARSEIIVRVADVVGELHRAERASLLATGTLTGAEPPEWETLRRAVVVVLSMGASVDDVAGAAATVSPPMARHRARGMLTATAAQLAAVEGHVMESSELLGGEVPVGDAAGLRCILDRARRDFDAAVRRAVLSGVTAGTILELAHAAGLEVAATDLAVAFEEPPSR